ncbi:unnamed protein product, partial [Meganyctiphanes norvegica]
MPQLRKRDNRIMEHSGVTCVTVRDKLLFVLLPKSSFENNQMILVTCCRGKSRIFYQSGTANIMIENVQNKKGQKWPKNDLNSDQEQRCMVDTSTLLILIQDSFSWLQNCKRAFMVAFVLNLRTRSGDLAHALSVYCNLSNGSRKLKQYHIFFHLKIFFCRSIMSLTHYVTRGIGNLCYSSPVLRQRKIYLVSQKPKEVVKEMMHRNGSIIQTRSTRKDLLKLENLFQNCPLSPCSPLLPSFTKKSQNVELFRIIGQKMLIFLPEDFKRNLSKSITQNINFWTLLSILLTVKNKDNTIVYTLDYIFDFMVLLKMAVKKLRARVHIFLIIYQNIHLKIKHFRESLKEHALVLLLGISQNFGFFNPLPAGSQKTSYKSRIMCAMVEFLLNRCTKLTTKMVSYLYQTIGFHLCTKFHVKIFSRTGNISENMKVLICFSKSEVQFTILFDLSSGIELLYPEKEPLPVPDYSEPRCVLQMSAMCILLHILKKAQSDSIRTPRQLLPVVKLHHEFLQNLAHTSPQLPLMTPGAGTDYRIALLLNAYSTNPDYFQRPILALSESIQGKQNSTVPMPGMNCVAHGATTPLTMTLLDTLTVHVKMSLIHNITQHITKQAQHKTAVALAPALLETYARLLEYTEIESIGIKTFITTVLPAVFRSHVWGILHALLEMFIHRIHHSQPQYRVQLLSTINLMPLNNIAQITQLHICMESVALRLIMGLDNAGVMPSLTRFFPEPKSSLISNDSEELNRVLVLTMARAINVTGCDSSGESSRWCVDFLNKVMQHTPHTWANHTLQCFPPIIAEYYHTHAPPRDNMMTLKKAVEEEYRKWKSMSNENDIITHFSTQHQNSPLFLCLLFKMVLETERVPPVAYKVLERVGPRALAGHVRTLCDFLVLEFSSSAGGQHVTKYVETMNAIIWKYNIVAIDRLMLCLVLRTHEGSEAHVCFFIIQLLLLKPAELRNRVQEFCKENSPDHWRQNNWYEKHMAFHRKFPEKFSPESILAEQNNMSSQYQTLPNFFSNVCLRFLPVLDIIIHRFLELEQVHKNLATILERLGMLYKFHDRPITYLYNTFHYYESKLRELPSLKRRLVMAVIVSQQECHPSGWALTEPYQKYLTFPQEDTQPLWTPNLSYYTDIVKRLVNTIRGKPTFPAIEWRFNEFSNAGTHALHVTCVELMALPVKPVDVANNLLDVLLRGYCNIPQGELEEYVNAVGLILTWLPEAYWITIHDHIIDMLNSPCLKAPPAGSLDPFMLLNLQQLQASLCDTSSALTLAVAHSFWHHGSFGQVGRIPQYLARRASQKAIAGPKGQPKIVGLMVQPQLTGYDINRGRKLL